MIGVLGCAVLAGCRPAERRPAVGRGCQRRHVGWIAPCGCTSNQSGGLARRATYVAGLRRQSEVILVDVGGAAHGTSPYDLMKFEAILRGEALMSVAAHNIGAAEARFGPQKLRRVGGEAGRAAVYRPTPATVPESCWRRRCESSRLRAGGWP